MRIWKENLWKVVVLRVVEIGKIEDVLCIILMVKVYIWKKRVIIYFFLMWVVL